MAFRVFEYSYFHAIKNSKFEGDKNEIILKFPDPKVILLEHTGKVPDYKLRIVLPHQEDLLFKVPTISLLDLSIEELSNKKMVILIPLYLVKLRKEVQKNPTKENAEKLKDLMKNGIVKYILKAEEENIITHQDSKKLFRITDKIYKQIYGGIKVLKEINVREALDEQFDLYVDDEISHVNMELRAEKRRRIEAEEKAKEADYKARCEMAKELLKRGDDPDSVKFIAKLTDKQISKLVKKLEIENHKN